MTRQAFYRLFNFMMGRLPCASYPPFVVQRRIAINRNTNQKVMRPEESCPFIINQNAIGLKSINDGFSISITLLERYRLAVKWQPHQRRFPTLPRKNHFIYVLRRNMLLHKQR